MKGAEARRERNRQEMRDNVLDAARRMVAEGGPKQLTIRGIARELGYSPGAIYEYFENKEAILSGLYYHGTDGLAGALENAWDTLPPEADTIERFSRMAAAFRNHALRNPELYRFTYNLMKQPKDWGEAPNEIPAGLSLAVEAAKQGIARGDLLDVNPILIAMSAWTTAHGFVGLEVSDHFTHFVENKVIGQNEDDPIGTLYRQVIRGVIRGWVTDQGRAKLDSL